MTSLLPHRPAPVRVQSRCRSAATDWAAWYPLDTSQARAALNRLARRGLVDAVGWDDGYLFGLTDEGLTAVNQIVDDDPGSEEG